MKAVCGPGGSDLKRKKILLPYSPHNVSINVGGPQSSKLYHSVQSSPKNTSRAVGGSQRESTLSTTLPTGGENEGQSDYITNTDRHYKNGGHHPVSMLSSI